MINQKNLLLGITFAMTLAFSNSFAQKVVKIYDGATSGQNGTTQFIGVSNGNTYWSKRTRKYMSYGVAGKEISHFKDGQKLESRDIFLEINGKKYNNLASTFVNNQLNFFYIVNETSKTDAGIYVKVLDSKLNDVATKKISDLASNTKLATGGVFMAIINDQKMDVKYDSKNNTYLFTYHFQTNKDEGLSYSRVIFTDDQFNILNQYEFQPSSNDRVIVFPNAEFLSNGDALIALQELKNGQGLYNHRTLLKSSQLYLPKDGSEYRILDLQPKGTRILGTFASKTIDKNGSATYMIGSTDESNETFYATIYKYNAEKDELTDQTTSVPISKIKGNIIPNKFSFKGLILNDIDLGKDGSVFLTLYSRKSLVDGNGGQTYYINNLVSIKIDDDGGLAWAKLINYNAELVFTDNIGTIKTLIDQEGNYQILVNCNDKVYEKMIDIESGEKTNIGFVKARYDGRTSVGFKAISLDPLSGKATFNTITLPDVKGCLVLIGDIEQLDDYLYQVIIMTGSKMTKYKMVEIEF